MAASSAFKLFQGFYPANIHLSRMLVFRNIYQNNSLWKNKALGLCSKEKSNTLNNMYNIPQMPKRPLSPFISYRNSIVQELKKTCPELSQIDISKAAAERWQSLPANEKEIIIVNFRNKYQIYKNDMAEYINNLTPEQKELIKQFDENQKLSKEVKMVKMMKDYRKKQLNKPKLPASAFFKFLKEQESNNLTLRKDLSKIAAEKWRQLPESKKQEYKDAYANEKTIFLQKINEWEEKMLEEGNIDVVRHKTIKDKLK